MTRRRRQSLSPTLFPFLAVLVCTLGTLILLLALVAQNTSDAAAEIAEEADQQSTAKPNGLTVGQVQDLIEEEAFRLEELISFREAQTGDLEQRRNQLAHVEDHMRRIRKRLEQIGDAMRVAIDQQAEGAATEQQLDALRKQFDEEEQVVRTLREKVQSKRPRFVIVPHQGPNGTDRRPIYLECTSKGVTIWPEGIAISRWQLENSFDGGNPLDDGLRAARYHAMQTYGDSIPPYPMLIVRPDGVDSYYAARAAMNQWDDQFGYELVPEKVELAYPDPDPAMRERIEYAVDQAIERIMARSVRQRIVAGGTRGSSATTRGRGPVTATRGRGPIPKPASTANDRPVPVPPLSVSQMDRQGRRSGYRDHRAVPGRMSVGGSRYGRGSSSISAEDAKRRLERQLDDVASSYGGLDTPPSLSGEDAIVGLESVRQGSGGTTDSPPTQTVTDGGRQSASLSSATASAGEHSEASQKPQSQQAMGLSDPRGKGLPSSRDMAGNRLGDADEGGRPVPGATSDSATNAASDSTGRAMGTPVNPYASREVSQRYRQSDSNASDARSSSMQQQMRNSSPSPSSASSNRMVQRRGVDWALPSSVALSRGNEIVRYLRIEVHPDRFVMRPAAGQRSTEVVPIDREGLNAATLQLATLVRNRVEAWGAAAPGARWSPRLKVDVEPGAEERFQQWARLMTGSGLEIERVDYSQADSDSGSERR